MGEYNLELEDRLYTSTEVAKILGVSLRSVYRYLEDEKLEAEMKTATGRHRFTKQNILDFLYPQKSEETKEEKEEVEEKEPKKEEVKKEEPEEVEEVEDEEEETEEEVEEVEDEGEETEEEVEEEVDWLSKFRKAAEKYKAESEEVEDEEEEKEEETGEKEEVSGLAGEGDKEEEEEEEEEEEVSDRMFYTSEAGGLKEVAQKLDKSARKASLDYAFTMQAGLSLHKPISPFSLIHAYVKSEDLPFFEKILDLTEAKENDAQLCLIIADEDSVYKNAEEMHGLNVVADKRLKKDLMEAGEEELAEEL